MQKFNWIAGVMVVMAGSAGASAPAHPDSTETGTIYHGAEYTRVDGKFIRVDSWRKTNQAPADSKPAADGWRFVGGEIGWDLEQHSYDFVGGRLVHSDRFSHDAPRPALPVKGPPEQPGG